MMLTLVILALAGALLLVIMAGELSQIRKSQAELETLLRRIHTDAHAGRLASHEAADGLNRLADFVKHPTR